MDWKIITELVDILAWPVVVVTALIALRRPLGDFLSGLSRRLTKFSAFDISIELAELPSPPVPWSDPNIPGSSLMTGGEVNSTSLMTLFQRIGVETPWDYLIIDIKDGKFWLISRVFIFTVFLQMMRGVQCVVFVESSNDRQRQLIGIASPNDVRAELDAAFPWFEQALLHAMSEREVYRLHRSLDASRAGEIIRTFIEHEKMRMTTPPNPPADWTQLGTQSIWEHTRWLTLEAVNTMLRKSFFEWDASRYNDLPGTPAQTRLKDLLYRKAPFVALVNSRDEFQRLLDRQKLAVVVGEALIDG